MSRTEAELWDLVGQANDMPWGEEPRTLLEDVIRHADTGGFPRLAFYACWYLASEYSVAADYHKVIPLFSRCLSEHERHPEWFGPEEDRTLRHWYPQVVRTMAEFPETTLDRINQAFDHAERLFRAGGHNPHPVYDERRWVAQMMRDWETEDHYHRLWLEAGGPRPGSVWGFEAGIERLVLRGDDASLQQARELAAPALTGEITFDESPWPIQSLLLMPLVRAGEFDRALRAHRLSNKEIINTPSRIEYTAMHLEFLALTGNEDEGIREVWRSAHLLEGFNRPNGEMEMAASIALVMRRLDEAGRGDEPVFPYKDETRQVPAAALREEMTTRALELAARFDARNGTTAQGDRIRARIAAEPVVDFLPLTPTSRNRRPWAIAPGRSAEQLLDHAEWHTLACQEEVALTHLNALPADPPADLAVRTAELRAVLDWGSDSERVLRWAAEEHRCAGDQRRHLLARSWLALWLSGNQRGEDALAEATAAVEELHRTGDAWAIAWGELRMARVRVNLHGSGMYPAIRRAAEFAELAGDPLALGVITDLEAYWRESRHDDPEHVIALATTAKDALLDAGAYRKTISAFVRLSSAHERAGTLGEFVSVVRRHLEDLPPHTPEEVYAWLRYQHGEALLLDENRAEEAVGHLAEAVSVLQQRELDPLPAWYALALASTETGRADMARHAADRAVDTMDRLRAKGELAAPERADTCRRILAKSCAQLGDNDQALEHYATLVRNAREVGSRETQMVGDGLADMARLLLTLDRKHEAAQRYLEAAEVYTAMGWLAVAAQYHCSRVLSLFEPGDVDAARDALGDAERAVERAGAAEPAEPAVKLAIARAQLAHGRALVTAEQGRGTEAASLAARSSAAWREAGRPSPAINTDLLQAELLLEQNQPDLAEPVLRTAHTACDEDDPRRAALAQLLVQTLTELGRDGEAAEFHDHM